MGRGRARGRGRGRTWSWPSRGRCRGRTLVVAEPPERPPTSMGFRGYNYVPSSRILAVPYMARIRLRRTLSRTGFDIMSLLFILVPLVV